MEERGISGEFESLDPTIPTWTTEATPIYETDWRFTCHIRNMIPNLLILIIALVGLSGNVVVLWLLSFRIRRNAISVYILNLAAANSLFLCCHFMTALEIVLPNNPYVPPSIYDILLNVTLTSYITGLGMLCAISTERCLCVLWPIWYRCKRPRHTSAVICALLWALSVVLSFLKWYSYEILYKDVYGQWYKKVDLFISAWLIFFFVILSASSLALLGRILRRSQRKPMTRLYVTILLTVLIFLLCGLPLGILLLLIDRTWEDFQEPPCLRVVIIVLSSVNSSANPFIYFFVGSFRQRLQQRQTLKMVLQRALQDSPEDDECGGSPPRVTLEMSGSRGEQ